jgi:CubicO group peptidase (beta-lactamase class C family)
MNRIFFVPRVSALLLAGLFWAGPAPGEELSRREAEKLVWHSPHAKRYAFSGTHFPSISFEHQDLIEGWIGPYTIKATFHNAAHEEVSSATNPGRYGAVVEIESEAGTLRRFLTLFRLPRDVNWWREKVTGTLEFPPDIGVDPRVAAASTDIGEFLGWKFSDALESDPNIAVLLAGLHECGSDAREYGFYESVWIRDRQWWLEQKRKMYGWDEEWPEPFAGPRRIEGEPARVLREGSFAEAEMKPELEVELDRVLAEWAEEGGEALAVCLARHGVVFYHKAFGTRDGKPMTVDTLSSNASSTKLISGTLWGMLVDQGLASLDDPIGRYLPPLRNADHDTPITIRRLYNHTADFDGHWGDWMNDMEERVVPLLPHLQVGKMFHYSSADMGLACKALEAITGKCLALAYKEYLVDPLGGDGLELQYAGFGSRGTPLAMARILQVHLNGGAYGPWRFFSEETAAKLQPLPIGPQVRSAVNPTSYGMGTVWVGGDGLSLFTYGHGGGSGIIFRMDPVHDLVIVASRREKGRKYSKYAGEFIRVVAAGILDGADLPDADVFAVTDDVVDVESGSLRYAPAIRNGGGEPFAIDYSLNDVGGSWKASSPSGRLVVPAGEELPLILNLAFDPDRPLPTPLLALTLQYGDRSPIQQEITLRPQMIRTTEAVRLARAPAIDGRIEEGEYGTAPYVTDFRAVARPAVGNKQTRFCVGYDDTHVFVAAIAEADNPAAFPQIDRGRDGEVWEDDSIELFFDGNHDHSTYIHLAANLRGDRYDGLGGPAKGKFGDKEWDADWQSAARTHDDYFVMEFAVPFSAMGVESPKAGTQFGLNVGRTRSATATGNKSEFTGWAIVYADFHQVTHFGDVTFRAGGDQP